MVHFFKFSGADTFPSDGEVFCVSLPSNLQAMLSSPELAGQTVLSMFPSWREGSHNLLLLHCVRRGWLNHGCRGYESLSTRAKGSTCCLHTCLSGWQPRCGWIGGKSVHKSTGQSCYMSSHRFQWNFANLKGLPRDSKRQTGFCFGFFRGGGGNKQPPCFSWFTPRKSLQNR